MKVLYTGGMRSGKSRLAELKALQLSGGTKPFYLATSEALDDEMALRIEKHKAQRVEKFTTIEEPLELYEALQKTGSIVLVECLSVWINNMLHYGRDEKAIEEQLGKILALEKDLVFVINEVGCGIIPENALAREFIDISGRVAQRVAASCDEVYLCAVGLSVRLK